MLTAARRAGMRRAIPSTIGIAASGVMPCVGGAQAAACLPTRSLHVISRCSTLAAVARSSTMLCAARPAVAHALAATHRPVGTRGFLSTSAHSDIVYTQKIPRKRSAFRDRVRIHVSGGRGGSGCSSYDTDPYGKGGPDGANGGRGGDVYLVSTDQHSCFALESFHLRAHNGKAGGSQLSKGANGYSLKVPIPAGSIVSEILATNAAQGEYTLRFLADLDKPGMEIKVASGGEGGLGNRAFKTKYRKQARFSTVGQYGTAKWLHLELKSIADVGLVGYPNAGKSSFLAAVSNATPEIANYPFTTLAPQIGVVEEGGFQTDAKPAPGSSASASAAAASSSSASSAVASNSTPAVSSTPVSPLSRFLLADLPGLISGAALHNRGLGHEFLKHIQRTKVLVYILDSSGNDGRDPIGDFQSLQQELHQFDPAILQRPAIIVANKTDNVGWGKEGVEGKVRTRAELDAKLAELATLTPLKIFPASCHTRQGLEAVLKELFELVRNQQALEAKHLASELAEVASHQRELDHSAEIQRREDDFISRNNDEEAEEMQRKADREAEKDSPPSHGNASRSGSGKTSSKKPKRLTKKQIKAAEVEAADAEAQ